MASKRRRKPRPSKEGRGPRRPIRVRTRQLPWIVFAVSFFVFLAAVGNDFVNWDDDRNFLDNPFYRGLSFDHLWWMATTFHLGHYHPLTWLTLGVDFTLWGMSPAGYHFTNIVLHAITAVLVYYLILLLLQLGFHREWAPPGLKIGAVLGALLFAIHPLRVESVAWVSERRDVLSGLFYVATLLLYVRGRLMAALTAFTAALLSKVIVVTLPVVFLILDWYPIRRRWGWRVALEKVPFFALALGAGLIGVGRYEAGMAGATADLGVTPWLRVMLSFYGLAFYVWKTLLPFGLYAQYVYSADPQPWDVQLVVAAVFVIGATVGLFLLRRRWPAGLSVWACYVVTLLPVLSLLRLDRQQYVADHHSYLATLGLAVLGGALFYYFFLGRHPQWALFVSLLVMLVLCERTVRQVGVWENSVTLWTHTLEGSPLSIVAHNNLGRALAGRGQPEQAIEHFRRAVEIRPSYVHARYNLGNLLMRQGRLTEAEQQLRQVVDQQPGLARAHSDLGNCLLRLGKTAEAVEQYREALRIDPLFADVHYNLAMALHRRGLADEAEEEYQKATELDPANADAHNNWGVLLESQGDLEAALAQYRRALEIEPGNPEALRNLRAAESREPAMP
ncbi:MAG: tetratricopeptide repeat protein [Bryobacterales bacterium]